MMTRRSILGCLAFITVGVVGGNTINTNATTSPKEVAELGQKWTQLQLREATLVTLNTRITEPGPTGYELTCVVRETDEKGQFVTWWAYMQNPME